ncbi:LOW QUALITY PROTEIN: hypothetical protein BRADI_3g46552v3 [Brachypodium distachyon]|uniref:Glycosyltransferase n=1 Tax=Brachypodium distachyon TaxID=15368 RepID=A0A2K2D3M9_BRADI|nr:LOW QUALITY PROTEIN: hypothetical protein BRADI_3g46552v3 [Brachypodium distachyon]
MAGPDMPPHAVFFPFPAQGHVKPALQLAKLLHHCHGFQATFVHTEHNCRRLLRLRGADALAGIPGFRFAAVPDSLHLPDVDASQDMSALLLSLETLAPHFRNLVSDLPPVSCVVPDIEHILIASKEMGLPCVTLWTTSACAFMALQQCQHLVNRGIVPLKGFPKLHPHEDAILSLVLRSMVCHKTTPSAVIFHTFDELEHLTITAMSNILPPIYAIGPLPLLLDQLSNSNADTLESNHTHENRACLEWLKGKRPNSVVYVSFGSITTPTNKQLVELAWGLANSRQDFLWVIRNDQEVLQHKAIGAFLTHCGWNSMLESISTGVPMLCWSFVADQHTNSRYACSEWRVGMEIGSNRKEVESAIREVMEGDKGKEMRRMAMERKEKATVAALPGGPSWVNLEKVIRGVLTVPLVEKHAEIV